MSCQCDTHVNDIHRLHDDIISSIMEASEVIPSTTTKTSKNIPGWDTSVSYKKEIALFWRSIWISMNSPRDGHVADIMRRTRAQYHYTIRKLKRSNDLLRKKSMARAISEKNSRNLWCEAYKIRRNNSTVPNCIDNVSGAEEISNLFLNKYSTLYNSVSFEREAMNDLLITNGKDIITHCDANIDDDNDAYTHTHVITVAHVKNAIHKMKCGKSDCIDGILSDNFKEGTDSLYTLISLLFSAMLMHGVPPAGLLISSLVPIPKNKRGNKCDSENYRQIAISSLMGKLFDSIVLEEQQDSLFTDLLQFGFKKKSSTVVCTSLLKETIEYYNENNTDCYLLLLDASKAFDRVEYMKLFNTLRDRKMCPLVLRLLMNMYINQQIQVKWNSTMSMKSSISNGVKQGGCLSPNLFSVYLNKLIEILRNCNIGCRYGNHYMGVYCYADDLSLLSPTFTGLQEMLKICELYANNYDIIFNAKKSQLLYFGCNSSIIPDTANLVMQNGQSIQYVNKCSHLGNELCPTNKNVLPLNAVNDLNCRLNNLLADFSHCDSKTLSVLFRTYCMNVYGSQIWAFNKTYLNKFYVAWRKAIRRIWKLPYRTHNNLLHLINLCLPIDVTLEKRCIKYTWNLINGENKLYDSISKLSLCNNSTTLGENIRYFMYKYKIYDYEWYGSINVIFKKIDSYVLSRLDEDVRCDAIAIRELCESRDSCDDLMFDRGELHIFIETLCTI